MIPLQVTISNSCILRRQYEKNKNKKKMKKKKQQNVPKNIGGMGGIGYEGTFSTPREFANSRM